MERKKMRWRKMERKKMRRRNVQWETRRRKECIRNVSECSYASRAENGQKWGRGTVRQGAES